MSETTCRHCGKPKTEHVSGSSAAWCDTKDPFFTPGPTHEALAARVALLEEALRPFAEAGSVFRDTDEQDAVPWFHADLTIGHYLAAGRALATRAVVGVVWDEPDDRGDEPAQEPPAGGGGGP